MQFKKANTLDYSIIYLVKVGQISSDIIKDRYLIRLTPVSGDWVLNKNALNRYLLLILIIVRINNFNI